MHLLPYLSPARPAGSISPVPPGSPGRRFAAPMIEKWPDPRGAHYGVGPYCDWLGVPGSDPQGCPVPLPPTAEPCGLAVLMSGFNGHGPLVASSLAGGLPLFSLGIIVNSPYR